ncbi:MAG: aminotransferase class I/II-fold pyridoxal phosphate-dependent enzyme, partial [Bacteroidetes bacterium]|nr:aminotransferase class I/II-fold pyridoxal phosphate-dependent enzyme [Bacteroidota bacterium]
TVAEIVRIIGSDAYRLKSVKTKDDVEIDSENGLSDSYNPHHYFETLFVDDDLSKQEEQELKEKFSSIKDKNDPFVYEILFARSFQDALTALLFNYNIQCVVLRYGIKFKSKNDLGEITPFLRDIPQYDYTGVEESDLALILAELIKDFRPELDIYYVTDRTLDQTESEVLNMFRRIFYRQEDVQEAHLSIRRGIDERFEAPFFKALVDYSKKPTGVFHAMPISRGNSVFKSNWIKDMGSFYGRNIFLAETSATTGGLDSLLQPTGPLKKAQKLAAEAFGAQHTYFVTNGTSTANKIVLQGLAKPGDIVLIDRDCHKSHHYALVLSGAHPIYLDSYPIPEYSMYGAVPLWHIKEKLLALKEEGRLHKVKMLILTNCTFDGIVYNVRMVMEEILAIKPDIIFLWDEAWFGFACFTSHYRHRTAMWNAQKLHRKYASKSFKQLYNDAKDKSDLVDPEKVRIRVYSTQSTHKTLSSLRQGSMIHIYDQDFKRKSEENFHEAYMTHTSTSANYQILASLDVGRRQAVFEGYELVEKSIEMSMALREKIINHPDLAKYFKVLTIENLIPREYRSSGLSKYYDPEKGWSRLEKGWHNDEFVLDPTKINLHIGRTGVNGDDFKNQYLMDQFGIQVNKTTRNTVLFMTNIGTTRSSVAYLTGVLLKISKQLDEEIESLGRDELRIKEKKILGLTQDCPPLPDFSAFHNYFKPNSKTPEGNLRKAYFMAYDEENCMHMTLKECDEALEQGMQLVSSNFVIPYPPGFPVLVPGQLLSREILNFMIKLDVKEIHGYKAELGLLLFKPEILVKDK